MSLLALKSVFFLGIMMILSPLLALSIEMLQIHLFDPLFTRWTTIAVVCAPLETTKPAKGFWHNQLQQLSTFTNQSGFTVDLSHGWIANNNNYANTGPDTK